MADSDMTKQENAIQIDTSAISEELQDIRVSTLFIMEALERLARDESNFASIQPNEEVYGVAQVLKSAVYDRLEALGGKVDQEASTNA